MITYAKHILIERHNVTRMNRTITHPVIILYAIPISNTKLEQNSCQKIHNWVYYIVKIRVFKCSNTRTFRNANFQKAVFVKKAPIETPHIDKYSSCSFPYKSNLWNSLLFPVFHSSYILSSLIFRVYQHLRDID